MRSGTAGCARLRFTIAENCRTYNANISLMCWPALLKRENSPERRLAEHRRFIADPRRPARRRDDDADVPPAMRAARRAKGANLRSRAHDSGRDEPAFEFTRSAAPRPRAGND
jgi:hypothetical protein